MPRSDREPVKIGSTIDGKYRVERVLGEGGIGIVVAAMHLELRQRVAIKLLRTDADRETKERFLREARAAVRLRGEHVARVSDVGKLRGGGPFLVMEMLHGEDLGAVVARGPLAVPDAVDLVLQACEGLAEAHALGIVHRDVKPRNLFLTRRPDGRPLVKILDFGIAKMQTMAQDVALTSTATIMGSPQYMSPEQMRASRDVDARSDIWSIGVTLYELLAATVPFDGPTMPDVFARALTAAPVPLPQMRADVPAGLWLAIERCLAKQAADRYADVGELAAALEPFAPPVARGTAERIIAVLHAEVGPMSGRSGPPPSPEGDTRIAAAFDSRRERPLTSLGSAMIAIAAVLTIGTVAALGLHWLPRASSPPASVTTAAPAAAPPTAEQPSPAGASDGWVPVPVDADASPAPSAAEAPAPGSAPGRKNAPHHHRKPDAGVNPAGFF